MNIETITPSAMSLVYASIPEVSIEKITPYKHQLEAADFLVASRNRILGDEPRVGKTGSALMAYEKSGSESMLVITTASGRSVWKKAAKDWLGKDAHVVKKTKLKDGELRAAEIIIVSWAALSKLAPEIAQRSFDVIVADESHYAKDFRAARTKAFFNTVFRSARRHVWLLTGTPLANSPLDIYPALSAFRAEGNFHDFWSFRARFCDIRERQVAWNRYVDEIVGTRNESELNAILAKHMLRRTQKDVHITQPILELVPVSVDDAEMKRVTKMINEASDSGCGGEDDEGQGQETFARIRRIVGASKSKSVADLVADDLESGIEKIVLMCWHLDTMTALMSALTDKGIGCVRVDGSVSMKDRDRAVELFSKRGGEVQVFIGQIIACGEAIDLSAASDLIFVESSYVPKDMRQAALRITNHNQKAQPRVRIATLEGSIDERVQAVVARKMRGIAKILDEEKD